MDAANRCTVRSSWEGMVLRMKMHEIMTRNVATVSGATGVRHAARTMLNQGVSGLPVLDDEGGLAGIVTEGDLMRRAELGISREDRKLMSAEQRARAYVKSHSWSVADVMTLDPVTVEEDTPVDRAAALMVKHGIKRLPVIREGRLVGIVSRADLLRAIATARPDATAAGDDAIRRSVLTRLCEDVGLDKDRIAVTVAGGVVHLWGSVDAEPEREAARVAAETVRGVAGVDLHMRVARPAQDGEATRQSESGKESCK